MSARAAGTPVPDDRSYQASAWILYDDFPGPVINPAKWYGWEYQYARMLRETSRSIVLHHLRLTARGYTDPATPVDELEGLNYLLLLRDEKVRALKADVKLQKVQFDGCDPEKPCYADLRIKATFFNAGTPTPGSYKDDISAMIYLRASSNKPGKVDIRAIVDRCLDDQCATSQALYDTILDTIPIWKNIVIGVEWDKPNQRFFLICGNASAVYNYGGELSDAHTGNTAKDLNARLIIPNTNPEKRSMAFIDARVGNVYVKEVTE
jgi:hypothetical protein